VGDDAIVETAVGASMEDRHAFNPDRLSITQSVVCEIGLGDIDHDILDVAFVWESEGRVERELVSTERTPPARQQGRHLVHESADNGEERTLSRIVKSEALDVLLAAGTDSRRGLDFFFFYGVCMTIYQRENS
jgi:hypothetical protein